MNVKPGMSGKEMRPMFSKKKSLVKKKRLGSKPSKPLQEDSEAGEKVKSSLRLNMKNKGKKKEK